MSHVSGLVVGEGVSTMSHVSGLVVGEGVSTMSLVSGLVTILWPAPPPDNSSTT